MSSHSHHTSSPADDRWSSEVVPHLPAEFEIQAHALGALRRKRCFPSASLLLRGLLAYALQASSLAQIGAWGVLTDTVDVAASSWLKRLRAAAPWLTWLLSSLLAAQPASWLRAYGRWRPKLIDLTCVGTRGGSGDDWRLQLSYDLLSGQFDQFRILVRSQGEALDQVQLQPDDIAVVDAGYGRRHQIAAVVAQLAAIVTRVYLPTCPLVDQAGRRLDLVTQLARRGRVPLEMPAIVEHQGQQIAVRVLAVPLPPEQVYVAQQRLRKTARRKGRSASSTGLLLASWLVLLTTLPAEPWSASAVVELYRARWQIEVVFKRLKQLLGLHQLSCTSAASAVPLLTLYLIGWALTSELVQLVRPALQAAAAPAPTTLPGQWPAAEAVVSSWRVQQLSLDLLKQQVWGQWTAARLTTLLPRLVRHLVSHPRADRRHQETAIRRRLSGQRLTRPRPQQEAE